MRSNVSTFKIAATVLLLHYLENKYICSTAIHFTSALLLHSSKVIVNVSLCIFIAFAESFAEAIGIATGPMHQNQLHATISGFKDKLVAALLIY